MQCIQLEEAVWGHFQVDKNLFQGILVALRGDQDHRVGSFDILRRHFHPSGANFTPLHAQQLIQGCCHPGHVGWLALEWIRLEAEKRRNKSLQSKTTRSGLPPLTHKPLGQGQGPKGPALAPKQSQAQKWVEAESRALLSTGGGEEAERRRRGGGELERRLKEADNFTRSPPFPPPESKSVLPAQFDVETFPYFG